MKFKSLIIVFLLLSFTAQAGVLFPKRGQPPAPPGQPPIPPNTPSKVIVLGSLALESPLTVLFDASQSTDLDGIQSFAWDFGDGTQGTGAIVSHVYPENQANTASMTLTDTRGASVTANFVIPALAGSGDSNPPPPVAFSQAKGIYVVDDNDPNFAEALALPYVDGAVVRAGWEVMEQTQGQYDFTILCNKVTAAHQAGKKVSLVNYALAPAWLVTATQGNGQWTSPIGQTPQPMPWDATALAAMRTFAEAEANFSCGGYPLKNHPAIAQVDTPILAMQSIRQAPSYTMEQMLTAVETSVQIWHDAFGEAGHIFYTGLFPLNTSTANAITVRDAVQAVYPNQHWFQETWTGAGPSGSLSTPIGTATAPKMLQACGYWSQKNRITCTFAANDTPKLGYDTVGKPMGAKYFEIYPDDLLYPAYQTDIEAIHDEIWL